MTAGEDDAYRYDAFISYSHRDKEWVRGWLLPRLEDAGLRVCIDFRDFEPGAPILTEMERAVVQSRKTLLVLTPDYLASEWAEFENILASTLDPAARQRRVIPLLLRPCELPLRIRTLTYLDFTQPSEVDFQLQRLIGAIGGKPMPPRVRDRRIDAAVPSHAEVDQHIDLLVQVRFPDSPLLGIKDWPTWQKPTSVEQESERVALKFPIDHRTGKLGSSCLQVRVVAPDFTIEGADQLSVEVPPDQYSKCIPFLLTARKSGCCRIKVEVRSVDGIYLGTISCETTVGGAVTAPSASVATLVVFVIVHQPDSLKTPGRDELSVEERLPLKLVTLYKQQVRERLIKTLRDPFWQGIGRVAAVLALMAAVGAWFWPDIGAWLFPAGPAATPTSTWTPTPTTPTPTPTLTPTPKSTPSCPIRTDEAITYDGHKESSLETAVGADLTRPDAITIVFENPSPKSYSAWVVPLHTCHVTASQSVSFWVRGENGGEQFEVGIKDSTTEEGHEPKVKKTAPAGWQQVFIPLQEFQELKEQDLSSLENFSLGFSYGLGSGTIYVDGFTFSPP